MATDHLLLLGTLVGNFQSLECLLRFYLQALAAKTGAAAPGKPYCDLTVGEVVSIDEVSNYDTLGKLVQKYNADVVQRDPALKVDDSVVCTRDLLAHGRVSAASQSLAEMRILKFDKPAKGATHVRVVANEMMSDAWFESETAKVREQIASVASAYRTLTS